MGAPRYVLRQLSGIANLEALIDRAGLEPVTGSPEEQAVEQRLEWISKRLFGLTERDTILAPDEPGQTIEAQANAQQWWERHFEFLDEEHSDDEVQAFWADLGWDVADEHGHPLRCLSYLERQMVCATRGLRGKLPEEGPSETLART
jgi:hypothetical protein